MQNPRSDIFIPLLGQTFEFTADDEIASTVQAQLIVLA